MNKTWSKKGNMSESAIMQVGQALSSRSNSYGGHDQNDSLREN